jgi:hypothetical protein
MEELKDVVLHVYQLSEAGARRNGNAAVAFLSRRLLPSIGMGAYHTSVEVDGQFYTFAANAGIVKTKHRDQGLPADYVNAYQESIVLGASCHDRRGELNEIIQTLSQTFTPTSYHLAHRNCNHFTETLATALILRDQLSRDNYNTHAPDNTTPGTSTNNNKRLETFPQWINRLANTGRMVIAHDDDIVPCDVWKEAICAVGADQKVGWDIASSSTTTTLQNKRPSKSSQGKKTLTPAQAVALAKLRKK